MCGLFGLISFKNINVEIVNFCKLLAHRGPDDYGALYWKPNTSVSTNIKNIGSYRVAMGHQRLSILDLSPLGHQPISSPDGRWHMVYNGEVYNYLELRSELELLGYTFQSNTDTEVILGALVHWGHEYALTRFIGMFALVLLDIQEETLLLARDPFGIKPLYLCKYEDGLAFSSEIKPLLTLPGIDTSLNAQRTFEYLRYGVTDHGSNTMLNGIRQIPAASWCKGKINNLHDFYKFNIYWDIEKINTIDISFEDAVEKFRNTFLRNIELHLRSDVPIGCALSGGLDSSAIACAIRHLYPNQEIHTFSFIANEEKHLSEKKWVDIVNKHINAIPHFIESSNLDLSSDLSSLLETQGEPFGSTSIYAQYALMREVKRSGIKVILDGQGADEMLGGYPWYQGAYWLSLLYQLKFMCAWRFLKLQSKWSGRNAKQLTAHAAVYVLPRPLLSIIRKVTGYSDTPPWINKSWFTSKGVDMTYPFSSKPEKRQLHRALKDNIGKWGLAQLLRYEDRNSMAFSIESRVPFLTTELVELTLSLPEEYLISNDGTSKYILREALRGIVPDIILNRRDKIGFASPEMSWLVNQKNISSNIKKDLYSNACFDNNGLDIFINDIVNRNSKYNTSHLWKLINFSYWYNSINKAGK